MPATPLFRVGLTADFETHAKGVLDSPIAEVLAPVAAFTIELMKDTGAIAQAEELDLYDAVIALDYHFPAASFQGLKRLALIARWGVGYDRIDLGACTAADVILAITRDSIRRPVAEGILALIFALAKNLPTLDRSCRTGRWRQDPPRSINLAGRTLGSIGLGNIAGEMFRMARALGFGRLLAYSPRASAPAADAMGVELAALETVMRESDFVAVNCPLTEETRGMIGTRELGLMRPNAYLINAARGAVVDETALTEILRQRKIAGAGLDVFATEPLPAGHPLSELDNVILTPHLIARTDECVRDTGLSACRSVLSMFQGVPPAHVANPEVLARARIVARLSDFARGKLLAANTSQPV
jgi:phosphoglycerate dehydrogenase-like enzyme